MHLRTFKNIIILLSVTSFVSPVLAEKIKFPDKELATETVLPVFENAPMVKNRNIVTAKRFELGLGGGLLMTEPLYDPVNYHFAGTYHFDEIHGFNFTGLFMSKGLGQQGDQLKNGEGLAEGNNFDASLAPSLESMYMASYQWTAYYGKISVTKQSVMNLSLYGLAGVEMVDFGDSTNFGVNLGLGQKFYFGSNFALRMDLRLLVYQGPDPTSDGECRLNTGDQSGLPSKCETISKRSSDDLETRTYYNTLLSVGAVFLL